MPRRRPLPPHANNSTLLSSPLRIATQILSLQLAYYACTTTLILFTVLTAGKPFSADLVLSWRSLRGDTAVGWTLGLCWLVGGGLSGIILLLLLISRSKLVPDFALTLHALHLLITSLYSRAVPRNGLWWALQAASAAVMVVGGVWSCRWRELRPIDFGTGGGGGGGKGGGGGERGEYEMVSRGEDGPEGRGGGRGATTRG